MDDDAFVLHEAETTDKGRKEQQSSSLFSALKKNGLKR
jgi:hypothetical protein